MNEGHEHDGDEREILRALRSQSRRSSAVHDQVVLDAARAAAKRARPGSVWPAWLAGALAAVVLAVVGIELLLRTPLDGVRGDAPAVTPPSEARLAAPPRVFEWRAVPGAEAYRLVLRNAAADPVWSGPWQPGTRTELSGEVLERLGAGETYLWTVEVENGGRRELGPFWFHVE